MSSLLNDIFSLEQVNIFQTSGDWSTLSGVWIFNSTLNTYLNPFGQQNRSVGYFGGGGSSSSVNRIDYANDNNVSSSKGPLSVARGRMGSTSNSSYGWFGGGDSGAASSIVDRINYASDTATASPRGSLTAARTYLSATGNSNYGWFGGGDSGPASSIVDRIDYASDTATASPRGPLSLARSRLTALGNSSYGWFAGGFPGPQYSTIDRIDYSNDTTTTLSRGVLNLAVDRLAASGNSSYGWFFGGGNGSPVALISTVSRFDYANDFQTTESRSTLVLSLFEAGATGNSSYGWIGGGRNLAPANFSIVQRLNYSNDTTRTIFRGPLNSARFGLSGSSSLANGLQETSTITNTTYPYGYFGGGAIPANLSTIDRLDFSNDNVNASSRNNLLYNRSNMTSNGNSYFGWFGAGLVNAVTLISIVERLDYANDTPSTSIRGPLSLPRQLLASTGNASYGWFGGGHSSGVLVYYSTVDRIDFANDTATASVRGSLNFSTSRLRSTGNSSYGWFGGGYSASPVFTISLVDRIDYANDTATASPRGPLSIARSSAAATGNSSYGWFGGGAQINAPVVVYSTVDRIDYANDTATASPRGPLSIARTTAGATGNSSYGWFGGGSNPSLPAPTPLYSRVDRIDYSNDTATATARGPLSLSKTSSSATSPTANANSLVNRLNISNVSNTVNDFIINNPVQNKAFTNYGYIAGGLLILTPAPAAGSTYLDRIDYANDTSLLRRNASTIVTTSAATSSSSYGYISPSPTNTLLYRIDYSNDDSESLVRGSLNTARSQMTATGNTSYGYFGGGGAAGNPHYSSIERVDYTNDTATASLKGQLNNSIRLLAATGNSSYGWFGGGYVPGAGTIKSFVDRINYANDTATASPRGVLNTARSGPGATGNSNYGWFGGGDTPGVPTTTIDRIDYANDTATASPRGPLSSPHAYGPATGNSSYGYFTGAFASTSTSIDRVNYSNDTVTSSARTNLLFAIYFHGCISAASNGMPQ